MFERIQIQQHKNQLRTGLLMLGLLTLLMTLGIVLMGWQGLIWAAVFGGVSMFLSYRVPTWMIMRMHRAQPLASHQLTDLQYINQQFSHRAGLKKIPKLYYIPSNQVNAFATGRKDDPAIALTYGLLRNMNLKEISGVLAHELSHIANNDLNLQRLAMIMSRLTRSFSLVGQLLLIFNFSVLLQGEVAISWLAILILIFAPYLANLLFMAISRTREFDADLMAAKITGDPHALADALDRLRILTRRRMNPLQRQLPYWLSTHPQIEDRIQRLRDLAPRFEWKLPVFW